jgi:hypothetical protein
MAQLPNPGGGFREVITFKHLYALKGFFTLIRQGFDGVNLRANFMKLAGLGKFISQ